MKKLVTYLIAFLFFTLSSTAQNSLIEWEKTYGGQSWEEGNAIVQTSDGGYIIAGWTYSNDGDVLGFLGAQDYWIIKLDKDGALEWQKPLGGTSIEDATDVIETSEGNFVVIGRSYSLDGQVTGNAGGYDYWIVKLNPNGDIIWQKALGGTYEETPYSIIEGSDGNYVVTGFATSDDGDVGLPSTSWKDFWIVKLDTSGTVKWKKPYGGYSDEIAYDITNTSDGGYLVAGTHDGSFIGYFTGTSLPNGGTITSSGNAITVKQYTGETFWYKTGFTTAWSCSTATPTQTPVANIEARPNSCNGLTYFYDFSENYATTWLWDFGDGNSSTDQHPVHYYESDNNYMVKLTASNGFGNDTITTSITINKSAVDCDTLKLPYSGRITTNKCSGVLTDDGGSKDYASTTDGMVTIQGACSDQITLTFLSFTLEADYDTLWIYDGPDSSSSIIGKYASTSLPNGGTIVSSGNALTIQMFSNTGYNNDGFVATWQCNSLTASQKPIPDFFSEDTANCDGIIYFYDQSTECPTTWLWDFDDGNVSSNPNPSHVYSSDGMYNIKLVVSNGFGSDSITKTITVDMAEASCDTVRIPKRGNIIVTKCNGVLVDDAGYSPKSWKGIYNSEINASVTILGGKNITLNFTEFEVATSTFDNYDYVFIYDGPDTNSIQLTDGDYSESKGGLDAWVIKLDISGNLEWDKVIGGSGEDEARAIISTSDGSYTIAGFSTSSDMDLSKNQGFTDYWLVNIDSLGNIQWSKTYGGSSYDEAYSLLQTDDNGYIMIGSSASSDGDRTNNLGGYDIWMVKTDSVGNFQWGESFGGSGADEARDIISTTDGGYAISGFTSSTDIDVSNNDGNKDMWVVKLQCLPVNAGNDTSLFCGEALQLNGSDLGAVTYSWLPTTNLSDPNIRNPMATIQNAISYVLTIDDGVCIAKDTINIGVDVDIPQLCLVTIDSASNKNVIVWEKGQDIGLSSYNIYRETTTSNVFGLIANVDANVLSQYVDTTSQPENKSQRYYLSGVDSCGNESDSSTVHKTTLLTASLGASAGEVNLAWENYSGFSFGTYYIWRWTDGSDLSLIDSTANNTFLFIDKKAPASDSIFYQLEMIHPTGCTPTAKAKSYSSAKSNPAKFGSSDTTTVDSSCLMTLNTSAISLGSDSGTTTLTITTDSIWTITEGCNWISVSSTSGNGSKTVVITYDQNTSSSSRSCILTVICGSSTVTEDVVITQAEAGNSCSMSLNTSTLTVGDTLGTASFDITANDSWTIDETCDWVSLSSSSGSGNATINVTFLENTSTSSRLCTITITCGSSSQNVTVIQSGATGIKNTLSRSDIKIYPNPSTGKLFIELSEQTPKDVHLQIYNSIGETVLEGEINNKTQLDISFLEKGVYIISITSESFIYQQKLILIR
ncbi:MAG: hypothetical protein COC01_04550 [Bacteroidetes bacterium]|nr:PKD domain-containing protein [Sphingobacteriaceae bacterium AH-315-L07]PCH68099.1 MAG: hypothetical protein COC01_04550 [Bacteroidota bacterium]